MGHVIIDSGREPYTFQQLLNGNILYKDIDNAYGPFAYQLNTFLFYLFGAHLNVLYTTGAVNAFIVLITTYLISRNITSITVSLVTCFIVITIFFFNTTVSNYIFPYIYSVIYAVSGFLLSVLFCIYFIKHSRPVFMFLALIFFSISFLSKYEFTLFLLPVIFLILSSKQLTIKHLLLYVSGLLLIPVLCWGHLFLQGVSVNDIMAIANMVKDYSKTEAFKSFYTYSIGFYPSIKMITSTVIAFIEVFIISIIPILVLYFILNKIKNLSLKLKQASIFLIGLLLIAIYYYFSRIIPYTLYIMYFSWLPITTVVILMFILFKNLKLALKLNINNDNYNNTTKKYYLLISKHIQTLDTKNYIYIFVLFTGILGAVKGIFFVTIEVYAPYILILPLLTTIVFIVDILPHCISSLNVLNARRSIISVVFLTGLMFLFFNINEIQNNYTATIKTGKGSILTFAYYGEPINETIQYIKEQIPVSKSFLMLPESAFLNFLTGHKTGSHYINLTPSNIDIYGEDKIIDSLKTNPPDYIFINNQNFYNLYFGKDYAQKVFAYVKNNYTYQTNFGNEFKIYIFKYNK